MLKNAVNRTNPRPQILWLQVCGLAALQGAIALTWVIYTLYLGKLLTQMGFTAEFAAGILVVESLLAIAMEPLMGLVSDRMQQWLGSRFPLIAVGVVLGAGLFMAIPLLVLFGPQPGLLHWLFPTMLVLWATAMNLFRSPALALLGRYAFGSGLPQAASLLTLMGALAGALRPFANDWLLSLGPLITFGVGSITLLASATALRWTDPNPQILSGAGGDSVGQKRSLSWPALALLFTTGAGIAAGFRLQMKIFPDILKAIPNANASLSIGAIFVAIALTAIPAGAIARRMGNRRAMVLGVIGTVAALGCLMLVRQSWSVTLVALALGTGQSFINNGTFPLALSLVPSHKSGLGIGMFFGGGALSAALLGTWFAGVKTVAPGLGIGLAMLGFLAAGICIVASKKLQGNQWKMIS
ncbi:MAG: MFS transporter [Thermosynechococcaceae cyanobacterium]